MRAHEHEQEQGQGHEHDEPFRSARATGTAEVADAREAAGASRLFEAAATGRSDVVGPAGMAGLQRAVGNSAVGSMLGKGSMPAVAGETESEEVQATEERSSVHDVVSSGGGQPLDTDTRTDMETRMGADFSDVRVHTDSAAHESAKDVGAHAYTVGNHVVFQRDSYDPSSPGGRTTLAHELTHVVQQRNGPVEGTEAPGGIRVSDPSDRFEQEAVANADRVLSGPSPEPTPAPAPAPAPAADVQSVPVQSMSSAPSVQRQDAEGEDEEPADVQGSFVQRAEEGTEEEEEAPPA
ncbi:MULTISPECIES: DUF4157 domain-containing protein [unclassified Streptomyces]|uniref:eCIS core domain-containing protein n=1 Tax=unclassified Streptomyces TaxID=2593676 RepID=UPI00081E6CBB|nr:MULTISPECIES: DUF4157 domain-containing protein [unclassified Streptomyces]MYZ39668.1 DUF4157 domain-containing protein [Streptomyces sp. SID4917]SCG04773.1 protein of unknown function [Streptomyces sp. MnatMP-M17]